MLYQTPPKVHLAKGFRLYASTVAGGDMEGRADRRSMMRITVREVMTGQVTAVQADTPCKDVAEVLVTSGISAVPVPASASTVRAARIMDESGVKRLVVTDAEGRLEGIVSRRDLLRMYLRDDDEIRRRVIEGLEPRSGWDDRDGIIVEVHDGIVTLAGYLGRRSEAAAAVHAAERTDGIVGARESLGWKEDDILELPLTWDRP
ncbi:CBS domain-containing protein [Nonomuraea sp. NPDC001684]